jgi:protein deglycase
MTPPTKILVPLAEGFEDVEAVAIIDVLRRAELDVVTAGLSGTSVTGSHGIRVEADAALGDVDTDELSAVVLPGGMPGTTNLMQDERVLDIVHQLAASSQTVAAICAATLVLDAAGVLAGHDFTCHPSVASRLPGTASEARVVHSGNLFTSRGPGTALEFSLALVAHLASPEAATELERAMLVQPG